MNRARKQAERAGYTVDKQCYPWIAYKGPRFRPSEWCFVLTDKEAEYRRKYITLVVVYLVMMIAICIGGCYAN